MNNAIQATDVHYRSAAYSAACPVTCSIEIFFSMTSCSQLSHSLKGRVDSARCLIRRGGIQKAGRFLFTSRDPFKRRQPLETKYAKSSEHMSARYMLCKF